MGYRVDTLMAQHADAKLSDLPLTPADRPMARSAGLHGRGRAEHASEGWPLGGWDGLTKLDRSIVSLASWRSLPGAATAALE
jgi:hypothetical protein